MPISDGTDAPGPDGIIREPLIEPHFKPQSVSMKTNPRFVPTAYIDNDSDPNFPAHTVLGVKLIPRSGLPKAAILVKNDGSTSDASVRIASVPIAKIVNKVQAVQVANLQGGSYGMQPRDVGKIVLKETYDMGNPTQATVVTNGEINPTLHNVPLWALKKAGGDVDSGINRYKERRNLS
jgi:hypothetical protein